MTNNEKQKLIDNMGSICKNCNYISVDDKINRFVCMKTNDVVMGLLFECNMYELKLNISINENIKRANRK